MCITQGNTSLHITQQLKFLLSKAFTGAESGAEATRERAFRLDLLCDLYQVEGFFRI